MSEGISVGGVIVGVDGSPSAQAAVEWAAHEAWLRGLPLRIVHVVAEGTVPAEVLAEAEATARIGDTPVSGIDSSAVTGEPVAVLTQLSKEASMVVVGCHGKTTRMHRLLGSVSTGLLRHGHCPIAVIHNDAGLTGRAARLPVLVGVDGSRASELAAEIAFDEAVRRGVGVLALHVCRDADVPALNRAQPSVSQDDAEEVLKRSLTGLQEDHPAVAVHRLVRFEYPARQLLIQSERAQLLVVGSHGRGGFGELLLGSVSTAVARDVRCPVIVARHD